MRKKTLTPLADSGARDAVAFAHYKEMEADTLARTVWGEARGEGVEGMQAVACVIMNRLAISIAKDGYWWGNNVIQICQKPYQFSCWNRSDPNYRKLINVDESDIHFASAVRVANRAIAGTLGDTTSGATHYHASGVSPYWAKGEKPLAVIGTHIFYRFI